MILRRIPSLVLTRMLSRSISKSVISKQEYGAWKNLLNRSGLNLIQPRNRDFLRILPATSSRHLSTTNQRFKQEDSNDKNQNDGGNDKQFENMMKFVALTTGGLIVFNVLFGGGGGSNSEDRPQNMGAPQSVTYNDFFYNMLQAGEVAEITIFPGEDRENRAIILLRQGAMYKGMPLQNLRFTMTYPGGVNLEQKIREFEGGIGISPGNGMPIKYNRSSEVYGQLIAFVIFCGLIYLIGTTVRKGLKNVTGGGINPMQSLQKAKFTLVSPAIKQNKGVKFADVAGLKEAKVEVKEFVDYLKTPEKYKELGAKPPKGAILLGPPGCGKTMLAKAVANESNVPFLSMNGSEFIEMIGGLGASRVRSLFAEARKRAPAIVYIDEIDAIGRKRSEGANAGMGGTGEQEQTLNQLLVEMDGIGTENSDIIMLASTNRADMLDKALLRPGRFDRQIPIDLPTMIERKEILEQHMKGVKLEQAPEIHSNRLATLTPGFSGADLSNLVNEAALHAARVQHSKVDRSDLEYAIERVIAGPAKKSSSLGAIDRKTVAYHESGHAIVGWMLKHSDALLKVTIIPRTSAALGFAQYTPQDKKLYSPEELMDRMCMALGGRVAESLTFNKITTGAQNDLEKVTNMAYSQIKFFGFNDTVGLLSFEQNEGQRQGYSKKLQATMDQEARQLIARAYKITETVLLENKDSLELMAQALLEKETLNYDDVEKLIGPPPHGKKHLISPLDFEQSLNQQSKMGSKTAEGV